MCSATDCEVEVEVFAVKLKLNCFTATGIVLISLVKFLEDDAELMTNDKYKIV